MRLETKFVQVPNDPDTINAINNLAAIWGWTVQSIQVTDSKISYEGDSYGWVSDYGAYVQREIITEHTNYASITYQRDIDDGKYSQLTELEKAYNDCTGKQYLSEDEQNRLIDAQLAVDKRRSKYIMYAVVAVIVSIVISMMTSVVPFFYGLMVMGYFMFIRSKLRYDTDSACRALYDLNESREAAAKQKIVNQAKAI